MVSMTDSLFETPTLGDPGSSTIDHDIMRRRPCANGWLVDVAPARVLPSAPSVCAPNVGDTTLLPPPRSTILGQFCDRVWRRLGFERKSCGQRHP
jgi:hypothetical protein